MSEHLSPALLRLIKHERFNPNGWEPADLHSPTLLEMIEAGLLVRCDMRCGFEAMKDAGVKPTKACLFIREMLLVPA